MLPQPEVRRPSPAFLIPLSSLALLAACGGGGEAEIDLSFYLPSFPAPVFSDASFLGFSFSPADMVTVAQVDALLAATEYISTPAGIDWIRGIPGFGNVLGTNQPLRSSGAAFAHAAGLTGAGQYIAITDKRITPDHASLFGRVAVYSNVDDGGEHGTSVASVAAGSSSNFVGVAPEANLLFGTYDDPSNQTMTSLGNIAIGFGAVAWNNSWGFTDLYANEADYNLVFDSFDGEQYLNALRNFSNSGVVVFAASNDENEVNSGLMDGLPVLVDGLEAGWIAAVNGLPAMAGGDVQSVTLLSSSCWQAARWCLVADGSWNAAVGSGSDLAQTTGTSFAAPQISGALALLAEAFSGPGVPVDDRLTPHELRIRLLAAADDEFSGFNADGTVALADGFSKGYSVIYGHGFLDIEAALKPIGGISVAAPNGNSISTDAPVLLTGTGFGDAVETSLADTNVAVRDALSARFVMPAGALTAGARPGSQAGALLARSLTGNLSAERKAAPTALATPFAAFAGPVMTLTAPDGSGSAALLVPQAGTETMGFTLTRALVDGDTRVDLGLKLARDDGQIMSLDGQDAANMASVTLGITQNLGNGGFLALSGELGVTDLGGATALSSATSARFDALKLTAGSSDVFTRGDRLSVGVGMPMAIASGETVLDLPVVREGLAASFESVALDLAPEDRQIDLDLTYQTALTDGLEMKLSLIHSENFGNRAGETDTGGALAIAFRF